MEHGAITFEGQDYTFDYNIDSIVEEKGDESVHRLKCYLFFRFEPLNTDYVNAHIFSASIDNNDITIERDIPEGLEVVWHIILYILKKRGLLFFMKNPSPTNP